MRIEEWPTYRQRLTILGWIGATMVVAAFIWVTNDISVFSARVSSNAFLGIRPPPFPIETVALSGILSLIGTILVLIGRESYPVAKKVTEVENGAPAS